MNEQLPDYRASPDFLLDLLDFMKSGDRQFIAPQLLRFGIGSVLKILNKRITDSVSELISDKGVLRTAPAIPGLLKSQNLKSIHIEAERTEFSCLLLDCLKVSCKSKTRTSQPYCLSLPDD